MNLNLRDTTYKSALFLVAFTSAAQAGLAVYDPCDQDQTLFLGQQTSTQFLIDRLKKNPESCIVQHLGVEYYIFDGPAGKETFYTLPDDNQSICKPDNKGLKCPISTLSF